MFHLLIIPSLLKIRHSFFCINSSFHYNFKVLPYYFACDPSAYKFFTWFFSFFFSQKLYKMDKIRNAFFFMFPKRKFVFPLKYTSTTKKWFILSEKNVFLCPKSFPHFCPLYKINKKRWCCKNITFFNGFMYFPFSALQMLHEYPASSSGAARFLPSPPQWSTDKIHAPGSDILRPPSSGRHM